MAKPIAVVISDIHFTPSTLELASISLRMAKDEAIKLKVPLVLAGDTLDTKAIMRAECVNELIDIFSAEKQAVETYVLVGNHDLLNEKGKDSSLDFLRPYVNVVDGKTIFKRSISTDWSSSIKAYLLPYYSDNNLLSNILYNTKNRNPKGAIIICHQGVQTAYMGHYTQDKTSLSPQSFSDFRVISGHYHRRQDIKTGKPRKGAIGLFSYIGNPYTQNFGEASDGPKGFQILKDNGLLEFIPTNLRKHIVIEREFKDLTAPVSDYVAGDLVWLKVTGLRSELSSINKKKLGSLLFGHDNYKLDLISKEVITIKEIKSLSEAELFDSIIDNTGEPKEKSTYLKSLWREALDGNS